MLDAGELDEGETQNLETREDDEARPEADVESDGELIDEPEEEPQPTTKKRIPKEPMVLVREEGKSLLPFSRVQKIIKADKVRRIDRRIVRQLTKNLGNPNNRKRCDILDLTRDRGVHQAPL